MSSAQLTRQPPRSAPIARLSHLAAAIGLVGLPILLYAVMLQLFWERNELGIDFQQTLLPAAREIAAGQSPYPAYGYPPLVAFELVPFTYLPAPEILYTGALLAGIPATLWVLRIRDWRCYGAAFLWGSTFHAVQTGNVTVWLLLATAVAWRMRDSTWGTGVSSGLAIATKIICWPLVFWLAATRRLKAAFLSVAVGIGVTVLLWGALGFSGVLTYPSSIDRLESEQAPSSYTIRALLSDVGLVEPATSIAWLLGAGLALAAAIIAGRRGSDRRSYAFAVLGAVVASPIVWLHSFLLLLAPVAVLRPRFSPIWLAPGLLWFGSGTGNGDPWQTALVLGVSIATFVAVVVAAPRRTPAGVAAERTS